MCSEKMHSDDNVVRVGFDYGYPPYEYRNKDGVKGFVVDLIKEIGKEMAFTPKISANQGDTVSRRFINGQLDVITMFYTSERSKKYSLSNSFLNVSHSIFHRKGSRPVNRVSDLNGKRVLVEISPVVTEQLLVLAPKCIIIKVDNTIQAIEQITDNNYDYAVLPKLSAYHYMRAHNSDILVPTDIDISQNKYCFALHIDSTELTMKINEGLHLLYENGKFDDLYIKWFGSIDKQKTSILEIFYSSLYGIVPLISILLAVFLWNVTLKRQVRQKTIQLEKELEERKAIEENLQITKFALDHSVDCVFGIDFFSKIIYVNDSACRTLGYSKQELLSMSVSDIDSTFNADKWGMYWENIKLLKSYDLSTKQQKKDKTFINVEGSIYHFRSGNQEYMFAVIRDVTQHLKTEQELKRSEELFRNMFEKSSVIMYIADPDTLNIVDANLSAVRFYGYSKDELKKLNISDLNRLKTEDIKALIDYENEKEFVSVDLIHYKKDGIPREVTVSGSSIRISDQEYIFTIVSDNTEKNHAIKKLKDSEEKFFKAFMTSPDSININRVADGMYMDVNEGFLKIMGYTREEVIGKTLVELNIWQNAVDRQKLVKTLHEKNECIGLESNFVAKNGVILHGLMSARIMDISGEKCIISITRDITEKKKEEIYRQALYKISESAISTPDFDSLCKRIHLIVADLLPSSNLYIALYDAETEMFEYPYFVDEFDSPPSPRKRMKGLTEIVIDTGETLLVDPNEFFELVEKGKVETIGAPSIDWLGAPLKINDEVIGAIVVQSYTEGVRYNNENKKILSFVSNQIAMALSQKRIQYELIKSNELLEQRVEDRTTELRDTNEELQAQIEDRLRIENEIRESEERFRLMADSAPVMIWMTDSKGKIIYVNRTWLDFTGKEIYSALNEQWEEGLHIDDKEVFMNDYQTALENSLKFTIKVRMLSASGEFKHVLFDAVPRFFDGASFQGFVGSGIDITDMHTAFEREKELSLLKTRFISTVSHEYRTPLTTILTSTYLIDTFIRSGNSTEASKFLERIQNSVKSMTLLLDQVLTISRSDTGKLTLNPSFLNVNDFCSSFISEFKIIDHDSHIFTLIIEDKLSKEVLLDPNLIHQILTNLFTNAIKYSPVGSEIILRVKHEEDKIVLVIEDSGIGIPKEQSANLFEPFFRASNVGVIQGTGLGMSIVRRCVDLCGGEIFVQSEVGQGTSIELRLPYLHKD